MKTNNAPEWDAWAIVWLASLRQHLRPAGRALYRARGFSLAVIVTLALCIGANTAILSVLHGLLLKAMPFRDSGQLVEIYNTYASTGTTRRPMSIPQYLDYRAHADRFSGFALWRTWSMTFGEDAEPLREIGARVTADFFTVLGVQPLLGRFFTENDSTPGEDRVIVLTQSFWERTFRADPAVIGREVQVGGEPYTIVGVAPRRLESFNIDAHLFKPFEWRPQQADAQQRHEITIAPRMYARLRPGVSVAAGLAQLTSLEQRFQETSAGPALRRFLAHAQHRLGAGRVRAEQAASVRAPLLLLEAGVLFVLLIGCVNIASLMLARANARQVELAICQALGAGRGALARRLFAETALLTTIGTALGVALAAAGLPVINRYLATVVREAPPVTIDGTVLAATIALSALVSLWIGLLPAWRFARGDLVGLIQSGGRSATLAGRARVISAALVTGQFAIALVLLVGAGLLLRSFARVLAVPPGFDAAHIVHGRVALPRSYRNLERYAGIQQQLLTRLREIPGVESVALASHLPVAGQFLISACSAPEATPAAQESTKNVATLGVSPGFFATMGIRLVAGRDFADADTVQSRPAYIIDRALAERLFPGRSAVGQALALRGPPPPHVEWPVIVGVVESARFHGPENREGLPFVFFPLQQQGFPGFSMLLRTSRRLPDMVPLVRQKLREIDPTLPLYSTSTLQGDIDGLLLNRRGVMLLLGAFAVLALLLAAIGIYGMLAHDVAQRTREIGVRGALGATRAQIYALILRQGLGKAVVGLLVGVGGAFWLTGFLRSLLFDIEPTDPGVFAAVSLLLFAVATLACWLPARRAARVDPVEALRAE